MKTNDWMKEIENNTPLNKINIPGTHNSGTSEPENNFINIFAKDYSVCQNTDIKNQLDNGIRFLDLRLSIYGEKISVYHGVSKQKITFLEILSDLNCFLKNNPSETILVRIKILDDDLKDFKKQINFETKDYESIIWKKPKKINKTLFNNLKISEIRGKVLFFSDLHIPYKYFKIQDDFEISDLDDIYSKIEKVKKLYKKCDKKEKICLNYTSAVSSSKIDFFLNFIGLKESWTPKRVADVINSKNYKLFKKNKKKKKYYGIIVMDFPTKKLIEIIINSNFIF